MLVAERINRINSLLQQNGTVGVEQLAALFHVSEMTIRRDLERMEQDGKLIRCHGGAVSKQSPGSESGSPDPAAHHPEAKLRIAQYCAEHLIQPDSILYLDASSTVEALAGLISGIPRLTVLTNDIRTANMLVGLDLTLLLIGGTVQPGSTGVYGRDAEHQLSNYRIDAAFVSALTVNESLDVFEATENRAYFRRLVMECAQKTYLLVDSSKFDQQSLFKTNSLRDYTAVITNYFPPDETRQFMTQNQVQLISV